MVTARCDYRLYGRPAARHLMESARALTALSRAWMIDHRTQLRRVALARLSGRDWDPFVVLGWIMIGFSLTGDCEFPAARPSRAAKGTDQVSEDVGAGSSLRAVRG
jgi:hypothetical protein